MRDIVVGRRAVLEALRAGRGVSRLLVAAGLSRGDDVVAAARDLGIAVVRASTRELDEAAPGQRHQGVVAYVEERPNLGLPDVLRLAEERKEPPFLCLLDGIEDPHNLGAVLRSADAAGVHAVVVPERGAAHLSPGVHKASAGASAWVPVVVVSSLPNAMETLRRAEVHLVGAAAEAPKAFGAANLRGAVAFVIGGEEKGLSRLVGERCDERVRIPMRGRLASLNASVAASLLFYEKVRQDAAPGGR